MGNRRNGRRKKRKKPLGEPLPPATEDDWEITAEDIERAKQAWKKNARPQDADLLDAEIETGDEFE